MGLSLKNIGKKITDVLGGVERQVNPFDNGATYSNPHPAAPAQASAPVVEHNNNVPLYFNGATGHPVYGAPVQSRPNGYGDTGPSGNGYGPNNQSTTGYGTNATTDARSNWQKLWDQANPLDNGRTFKAANPRNKSSIMQQVEQSAPGNIAAPVVNLGKGLFQAGVHIAGTPVEAARMAVGQVTGDQAAQDAAARRAKTDVASGVGLLRAAPVAAYQLGESLNPMGGNVYDRSHTFTSGPGKVIFGGDPIPSMQTQYKQDAAAHGPGYASSAAATTAVMDALGGKSIVKGGARFIKNHDTAVETPGMVRPPTEPVPSTVRVAGEETRPVQVKPLPTEHVNDKAAARQAVLDAHNPIDNNVQVPLREGKIMGEGGARDQLGTAMVDTDTTAINTLRNIENKAGVQGHVAQFLHNTNMMRNAPKVAQHNWSRDPNIQAAVGGLSKAERAEFADYTNARAELNNYGENMKTYRTPEENQAIVNKYHQKYGSRFDSLNAYYRDVITPQAVADGRMTPETAAHYAQNGNYVHLSRDMEDLAAHKGQGKSIGMGKSRALLSRKGSDRALHDPVAASLEYTKQMETEHWKNVTATHLVDTLFRHGQATKLVDSEHVLARHELRKFLSDTREGKNVVDRALKTMGRKLRITQREVDALNKEGLDVSLKPRVDTRKAPNVQSRVKVTRSSDYKKVVKELKDNGRWKPVKASSVTDARTALKGSKWYNSATRETTPRLKEFAKKTGMTEDQALVHQHMKMKGVDAYINDAGKEVPVNISKLERHAGKMASEGRFEGRVDDVRANTTNMGTLNTKRAVENLMSVEPTELARIKAKLANREPKLAALIDHVEKLRDESEAFHTARTDAYLKARGLQDQKTANKNTITIQRNGAREVYEVSKDMKKVADQLKPYELGMIGKIGSMPARMLRGGATAINPVFAAANPIKDMVSSAILSKDATATHSVPNIASGVAQSAKNFVGAENSPLWHEFEGVGGDMTQYDLTRNIKGTNEVIQRVAEGKKAGAKQALKHPLRTLEDANSITEKATRFQNFKGMYESTLRKAGLSEEEIHAASADPEAFAKKDPQLHEAALVEARTGALENTINFNRAGSFGRVLNLAIPYSNAAIQGGRQLAKTTRDRPVQTIAKGAAWVGTPIAAATLWNTADPERKKVYENIDNYEKQNNLIFVISGTKEGDVHAGSYKVVKIPLPPDIGSIFQPVRQAIEKMKGVKGSDGNVGQIASEIAKPFTGPINMGSPSQMVGSLIPQAMKPGIQQAANRDFYTGKQIVPDYMKDANTQKKDRSYTWTSDTAKAVGKALNIEPVRVDKFVKDMFGTTGTMAVNSVDDVVKGAKKGSVKDVAMAGPDAVSPGFTQRFSKASAKTDPNNEAAKHFAAVDAEYQKMNKNDKAAYDTIHPTKVDGNSQEKTFYDAPERANIYKAHPAVLAADNKINAKSGDPFYTLPKAQQDVVLTLDTLKSDPGGNTAKKVAKDNPWLQDYYNTRSQFFDKLAASGKIKKADGSSLPQAPVADKNTQAALDQYSAITDKSAKSAFLNANPEIGDYFSATDQYQRTKRQMMGLPQFDAYPTPSPDTQRKLAIYDSLPQHDGKKGGNATRAKFIQANPDISDFFSKVSEYSTIKDAQMAVFEGEDMPAGTSGGSSSGSSTSSGSSSSTYKPYVKYGSSKGGTGYGSSGSSSGGRKYWTGWGPSTSLYNVDSNVVDPHGPAAGDFKSSIKDRTGNVPAKKKAELHAAKTYTPKVAKTLTGKPKVTLKRSK